MAVLPALLGLGLAAVVLGGCSCEGPKPRVGPAPEKEIPLIRVKLGSDVRSLAVAVAGPYRLQRGAETIASGDRLEWTTFELRGGEVATESGPLGTPPIEIHPAEDGTLAVRQPVDGKERERAYRGFLRLVATAEENLQAVNVLPMEAYLAGVLRNELLKSWEAEAYKAQAVAARTYALAERNRRLSQPFDVYDSQQSQVYGGKDTETQRAWDAVAATQGIVAVYRDKEGRLRLLRTFYHSTCGGETCASGAVFGGETVRPLAGVECPYCYRAKWYRWSGVVLEKKDIGDALRQSGVAELRRLGEVQRVEVAATTGSGRATKIRVVDAGGLSILVNADSWRRFIGGMKVPSTWFTIRDDGERIVLENGHGFGHGVGMCQWGAEYLAEHGLTGEQILRYYYPGVQLVRAY
jgi:stage II sporulation protein D